MSAGKRVGAPLIERQNPGCSLNARRLRAEGLTTQAIAAALGISQGTAHRLTRDVPLPSRSCVECGKSFAGYSNALTCSRVCGKKRDNKRASKSAAAVRKAAGESGKTNGRDCIVCGAPVTRHGRRYCPQHRPAVGRPVVEVSGDRDHGVSVEEFLEQRRPAWAREPGPHADAWAGYSAADATGGAW